MATIQSVLLEAAHAELSATRADLARHVAAHADLAAQVAAATDGTRAGLLAALATALTQVQVAEGWVSTQRQHLNSVMASCMAAPEAPAGRRSAAKRTARPSSDSEGDAADLEEQPPPLESLSRHLAGPAEGFMDPSGLVHRKHAARGRELSADYALIWSAADAASAIDYECAQLLAGASEATGLPVIAAAVVQRLMAQVLAPIAILLGRTAERNVTLLVEHKYGTSVAREFAEKDALHLGDAGLQRRLRRAQQAAKELDASSGKGKGPAAGGRARVAQQFASEGPAAMEYPAHPFASGANATPQGGPQRQQMQGYGRGGGRPIGPCYKCQGFGHLVADCRM
jgi:hypothetical protein